MNVLHILNALAFFTFTSLFSSCKGNCLEKKPSPTCFYTDALPTKQGRCYIIECRNGNFMPSIANGYVGTVIWSDEVHVAGVFNGKAYVMPNSHGWPHNYYNHTHRARIPSTCAINFNLTGNFKANRSYALDVEDGVFYQWVQSEGVEITQRIYAHRDRKQLLINEVHVKNSRSEDIMIQMVNNMGGKSRDINFLEVNLTTKGKAREDIPKAMYGQIDITETKTSPRHSVAVVWSLIPENKTTIPSNSTKVFYFITAISSSLDSKDPVASAYDAWKSATNDKTILFHAHANAWRKIWNSGRVELEGDLKLNQAVYGSLYYIISSTRADWPYGLSPGGLPGGEEYLGHTFWDQDIWMYPPVLMLHPFMGKTGIEYRYARLQAARKIAKDYKYQGAMFPWQSAYTGVEVCPGEIYGRNQNHITGDIAFAVKQYWMATGDRQWMKDKGFEIVADTAKFWASRVVYDKSTDKYVIYNVMPPDESHYPVNNSVYTNVVAKINIEFAVKLAEMFGRQIPKTWVTIAEKMYIPFDAQNNYHPEFQGFQRNKSVKQADTILIGYPLMYKMTKEIRENDLKIYENITNPRGPAMTHSMFAIGWLEVGEQEKAENAFKKNYLNIIGPFNVWAEIRGGRGATNFITGAGGFLQGIIFGYGGLRLKEDGLHFKCVLPKGVNKMSLRGVNYFGNSLEFNITNKVTIVVFKQEKGAPVLKFVDNGNNKLYSLKVGEKISVLAMSGLIKNPIVTEGRPSESKMVSLDSLLLFLFSLSVLVNVF